MHWYRITDGRDGLAAEFHARLDAIYGKENNDLDRQRSFLVKCVLDRRYSLTFPMHENEEQLDWERAYAISWGGWGVIHSDYPYKDGYITDCAANMKTIKETEGTIRETGPMSRSIGSDYYPITSQAVSDEAWS